MEAVGSLLDRNATIKDGYGIRGKATALTFSRLLAFDTYCDMVYIATAYVYEPYLSSMSFIRLDVDFPGAPGMIRS